VSVKKLKGLYLVAYSYEVVELILLRPNFELPRLAIYSEIRSHSGAGSVRCNK